jgi:hypothetical protein
LVAHHFAVFFYFPPLRAKACDFLFQGFECATFFKILFAFLNIFAAEDCLDLCEFVEYFCVGLFLLELLDEGDDPLVFHLFAEDVPVDLCCVSFTSMTDRCFSTRMDSAMSALSVYSSFCCAWL